MRGWGFHSCRVIGTTKHRVFVFVDATELLEHGVIAFGSADGYFFGVLSSAIHVRWVLAAKEEGAQIAADLGLPEVAARKPSFPSDPIAQTAAVFGVLAAARSPVSADALADNFRKAKNLKKAISEVLESLARLGHVSTKDGVNFELRRIA